jgi:hypothetical protein
LKYLAIKVAGVISHITLIGIIIIIIIITIIVITCIQGIYNYLPTTNHVSRVYSVAAVLYLQFALHVMLFSPCNKFLHYYYYYYYHHHHHYLHNTLRDILSTPNQAGTLSLGSSLTTVPYKSQPFGGMYQTNEYRAMVRR